jgi:hypothetical protein
MFTIIFTILTIARGVSKMRAARQGLAAAGARQPRLG